LISSQKSLVREQKKSENLIRNIFPSFVVDEIRDKGIIRAKEHEQIFVLFSDFVDFTRLGEMMDPEELVCELNTCFSTFDDICDDVGVEKLKTIGDGYFCVSGLHESDPVDSAARLMECAFRMRDYIAGRWEEKVMNDQLYWDLRIGLHCGRAIAGIVGKRKFSYDVWGDTVNTTARIESVCSPGKITASRDFLSFLKIPVESRALGLTALKGKEQPLDLWEVDRVKGIAPAHSHPLRVVRLGGLR
jgi:class 3 adenylate cyclase